MTLAEKTLHVAVRTVARLFGQTEDERLQAIDRRQQAKDKLRKLAIWWLTYGLALALLSGCSAREALRNSVRPLGLYEVQHPLHGGCHELGVRAHSDTLNRAVVVYGGVCVGINDSGADADAAVGE
jgi:hypothetical protein